MDSTTTKAQRDRPRKPSFSAEEKQRIMIAAASYAKDLDIVDTMFQIHKDGLGDVP
jgi:hypothetical protein